MDDTQTVCSLSQPHPSQTCPELPAGPRDAPALQGVLRDPRLDDCVWAMCPPGPSLGVSAPAHEGSDQPRS